MDVGGDDREVDRQLEPVRAAQTDLVQPAVLQIVDRRLHPGMLPARRREGRFRLALPLGRRFPALLRQSIQFQQTVQRLSVRRTVEAPVETASRRFGKRLQAALDQRRRDVGVAAAPHDLVVEHEPVPVLDDADRNAELDLLAGLALDDPPGVLLEDREHLLAVRNLLPPQHAAVDPVREAPCVAKKAVDLVQGGFGAIPVGPQRRKRSLRPVRDPARGGQIGPDIVRPGPPLLRFVHPALQRFGQCAGSASTAAIRARRIRRRPAPSPEAGSGPSPAAD